MLLFASLLYVLVGMNAHAHEYHPDIDALCFQNSDPELSRVGVPILGSLGVKEGVCQGMAGVTAAFLENARFDASVPVVLSDEEVRGFIEQLVQRHQRGTSGANAMMVIPGARGLRDFCSQHRREFMRASILYNADIATHEILPLLPELYALKRGPLRNLNDQLRLRVELAAIATHLREGRYPLMLYFKHVVMVTGVREHEGRVELSAYDSNHPDEVVKYFVEFDADGLPAISNFMFWDVTPQRR